MSLTYAQALICYGDWVLKEKKQTHHLYVSKNKLDLKGKNRLSKNCEINYQGRCYLYTPYTLGFAFIKTPTWPLDDIFTLVGSFTVFIRHEWDLYLVNGKHHTIQRIMNEAAKILQLDKDLNVHALADNEFMPLTTLDLVKIYAITDYDISNDDNAMPYTVDSSAYRLKFWNEINFSSTTALDVCDCLLWPKYNAMSVRDEDIKGFIIECFQHKQLLLYDINAFGYNEHGQVYYYGFSHLFTQGINYNPAVVQEVYQSLDLTISHPKPQTLETILNIMYVLKFISWSEINLSYLNTLFLQSLSIFRDYKLSINSEKINLLAYILQFEVPNLSSEKLLYYIQKLQKGIYLHPIHYAAADNLNALPAIISPYLVDSLEQKKIINLPNAEGRTALLLATFKFNSRAIEFLIHMGANVNFQDSNGISALMIATCYERVEVVKRLLLVNGINVMLKNMEGDSGFDLAVKYLPSVLGDYFYCISYLSLELQHQILERYGEYDSIFEYMVIEHPTCFKQTYLTSNFSHVKPVYLARLYYEANFLQDLEFNLYLDVILKEKKQRCSENQLVELNMLYHELCSARLTLIRSCKEKATIERRYDFKHQCLLACTRAEEKLINPYYSKSIFSFFQSTPCFVIHFKKLKNMLNGIETKIQAGYVNVDFSSVNLG